MSKTVYVGRIPFEMTEEQLEDIFRSTGPVQQTRLMFDRATGKSKGFAFVHYFDAESAASAVRNLDNYKVGNLRLKVNYSSGSFQGQSSNGGNHHQSQNQNSGPPRGPREEPQESGAIQDIVNTISNLSQSEKMELLAELTKLVSSQGDKALTLLDENPQFAYAIVQTMFEVGAIDGSKAVSLIVEHPGSTPAPPSREPTPSGGPPPRRQERKRGPASRAQSVPPQPAQTSPVQADIQPQLHAQISPQPQAQQQMVPAPVQPPPMGDDQKQMIRQILALTPEQLEAMPADQRNAALSIRQQVQAGLVVL